MKILICGNYGMKNIGDEAILAGLKKLILEQIPDAEIKVMARGSLFPIGFRSLFNSIFHPSMWFKPLSIVKNCDVFILGGGGLFSEEERYLSPLFWAFHGLIAAWCKKPVYCLGISVSRLGFLNKFFCKILFQKSKAVIVRDIASKNLLQEWGILSVLGTDPAIVLDTDCEDETQQENYVAISFRPFKNLNDNSYKIIAQFCDSIIEKFGLSIRFIPFQNEYQIDTQILHTIFDHVKRKDKIIIHEFNENFNELLKILAKAEMVIGMRLHSGILSILAQSPFISLSYMDKVKDFWSEFPKVACLDLDTLHIDNLISQFEKIWNDRREYRRISRETKTFLKKRSSVFSNLLAELKTAKI
ncbi:polysaccharide pyruvyl transferase family protein [Candidatus Peregrinibacteria bacterium]|nr:polysaccharide pyruvyl transferase family protein [Candidatus Peregrinibacteria bacterium]